MADQGEEQMLHGDVFIPHLCGLILRLHKGFVQILPVVQTAAGYFDTGLQSPLNARLKSLGLDLHLLQQLFDQAVLLVVQRVEQMLLLNLLVSIFISSFLQVLDSLY